ncbi:zinc-finger domain-containing protein [Mesorhizobium sp. M3A.F.Ca.ET.080.04.2.1]|nr:zinc-finger domain-containing protein [Mesorhizobium sp. M3A.F.Ca.ET.080.04.2.1]RWB66978.1 MAG: zinc-finger domain-containing protein [Mesorhizobium sp.]RWB87676.1 MAG: zinc-finger domain-containing protein [Mesorhizobium sp.]RWE33390.1 MAG: zinc-finger domain-containing protein [Mesorhizobium sp.]RWF25289.1 MAG: zinc-finger domain-containing protein [Mesorhizobium sp.]
MDRITPMRGGYKVDSLSSCDDGGPRPGHPTVWLWVTRPGSVSCDGRGQRAGRRTAHAACSLRRRCIPSSSHPASSSAWPSTTSRTRRSTSSSSCRNR